MTQHTTRFAATLALLAGCSSSAAPTEKAAFSILVQDYPEVIVANEPGAPMDIVIEDGYEPRYPIRVEFRSSPNCASASWFDCGTTEVDGVVRATELREDEVVDGEVVTIPFLACNVQGASSGTTVSVTAYVVIVDATGIESNRVDVSSTCTVE